MKNKLMPIILALIIGFIMGKIMINQYDSNIKLIPTFSSNKEIYFLQYGEYSTKEEMEKGVSKLEQYIYNVEDNKYYAYIGISSKIENALKIKEYYEKKGYDINIKEIPVNNKKFITILEQYDILIGDSKEDILETICKQIMDKYKELVLNDS